MPALILQLTRVGFLILLWLFVLAAIRVIRADLRLGPGPILIGRAEDSTLVLDDDYASTRHARLTQQGQEYFLEDLGSTNGTYLDRARVTTPTPVPIGVPIRIGRTVIELRP